MFYQHPSSRTTDYIVLHLSAIREISPFFKYDDLSLAESIRRHVKLSVSKEKIS